MNKVAPDLTREGERAFTLDVIRMMFQLKGTESAKAERERRVGTGQGGDELDSARVPVRVGSAEESGQEKWCQGGGVLCVPQKCESYPVGMENKERILNMSVLNIILKCVSRLLKSEWIGKRKRGTGETQLEPKAKE